MAFRASQVYRRIYVESAPPARVLDELFARLLLDLDAAAACIAARDLVGKGTAVAHALSIVDHFVAALDHGVAPELCAGLEALYRFVREQIIAANVHVDAAPLEAARRVVGQLREGFEGAAAAAARAT